MNPKKVVGHLPYAKPFLFVDELMAVDCNGAKGKYTFRSNLPFYSGHFKENPVTPGVILTECCAQIGVVCLGIFLLGAKFNTASKMAMTSTEMEFLLPVFPEEEVIVESVKIYFRFNKLKCKVKMYNQKGELVCKGVIAGVIKTGDGQ